MGAKRTFPLQRLFTEDGVVISGHVGKWEFLLGLRVLIPSTASTMRTCRDGRP